MDYNADAAMKIKRAVLSRALPCAAIMVVPGHAFNCTTAWQYATDIHGNPPWDTVFYDAWRNSTRHAL